MTRKERIAEAKEYLDYVVDQMAQADNDIKSRLRTHIQDIIRSSFAFGVFDKSFQFKDNAALDRKIDQILSAYDDSVETIIQNRSLAVKAISEDKNGDQVADAIIIAFIGGKIFDETMKERLARYSSQLKSQIEAYISIGYANGWSEQKILAEYMTWANNPLLSPKLMAAFRDSSYMASLIKAKGITYGSGNYTSVLASSKRLEQDLIFQSYNYADNYIWRKDPKVIGWASFRGSSYPCSLCDGEVGIIKPIREPFYQYHPNCCCIAIPIYKDDL